MLRNLFFKQFSFLLLFQSETFQNNDKANKLLTAIVNQSHRQKNVNSYSAYYTTVKLKSSAPKNLSNGVYPKLSLEKAGLEIWPMSNYKGKLHSLRNNSA